MENPMSTDAAADAKQLALRPLEEGNDKRENCLQKLLDLRLFELEIRDAIVELLREVHRQQLWKNRHSSLSQFCEEQLAYDKKRTKDLLIMANLILPEDRLMVEDPIVQNRIDKLRAWRKSQASLKAVAAFKIMPNRTLLGIAQRNPACLEELLLVPGIGPHKLQHFGRSILECLQEVKEKDDKTQVV